MKIWNGARSTFEWHVRIDEFSMPLNVCVCGLREVVKYNGSFKLCARRACDIPDNSLILDDQLGSHSFFLPTGESILHFRCRKVPVWPFSSMINKSSLLFLSITRLHPAIIYHCWPIGREHYHFGIRIRCIGKPISVSVWHDSSDSFHSFVSHHINNICDI